MGIRLLNTFLRSKCKKSINKINLDQLQNKTVVIDTSIYLYRFNDDLIGNFYHMCLIFRDNNITPIFVFDGKPPDEKKAELKNRKEIKKQAKNTYDILKEQLKTTKIDSERQEILDEMEKLKKQFIKIRLDDIKKVKSLFHNFGITYIDAHGEADMLCAYYVNTGKVYACISEDMDMFVYQCPRIIRYFSLLNEDCIMYDTNGIIRELKMNSNDFKKLCILSGTDYNKYNELSGTIFDYYNHYITYSKNMKESGTFRNGDDFLLYMKNEYPVFDLELYNHTEKLFNILPNFDEKFKEFMIKNTDIKYYALKEILNENGFIFI